MTLSVLDETAVRNVRDTLAPTLGLVVGHQFKENNMIERRIVIEVWGETEDDVEDAFEEAVDRLRSGNVTGRDENESGGFFFDNTLAG